MARSFAICAVLSVTPVALPGQPRQDSPLDSHPKPPVRTYRYGDALPDGGAGADRNRASAAHALCPGFDCIVVAALMKSACGR
jgi:hypothetical protein